MNFIAKKKSGFRVTSLRRFGQISWGNFSSRVVLIFIYLNNDVLRNLNIWTFLWDIQYGNGIDLELIFQNHLQKGLLILPSTTLMTKSDVLKSYFSLTCRRPIFLPCLERIFEPLIPYWSDWFITSRSSLLGYNSGLTVPNSDSNDPLNEPLWLESLVLRLFSSGSDRFGDSIFWGGDWIRLAMGWTAILSLGMKKFWKRWSSNKKRGYQT